MIRTEGRTAEDRKDRRQFLLRQGSALQQSAEDSTVRVLLIRGAGKDFCAGLDLSEVLKSAEDADAAQRLHTAGETFGCAACHPIDNNRNRSLVRLHPFARSIHEPGIHREPQRLGGSGSEVRDAKADPNRLQFRSWPAA